MNKDTRKLVGPDTHSIGVGCIDIDVDMARHHGWSDLQIERAHNLIRKVAIKENGLSHRLGPVKGCACIVCDPSVKNSYLKLCDYTIPKWRLKPPRTWVVRDPPTMVDIHATGKTLGPERRTP